MTEEYKPLTATTEIAPRSDEDTDFATFVRDVTQELVTSCGEMRKQEEDDHNRALQNSSDDPTVRRRLDDDHQTRMVEIELLVWEEWSMLIREEAAARKMFRNSTFVIPKAFLRSQKSLLDSHMNYTHKDNNGAAGEQKGSQLATDPTSCSTDTNHIPPQPSPSAVAMSDEDTDLAKFVQGITQKLQASYHQRRKNIENDHKRALRTFSDDATVHRHLNEDLKGRLVELEKLVRQEWSVLIKKEVNALKLTSNSEDYKVIDALLRLQMPPLDSCTEGIGGGTDKRSDSQPPVHSSSRSTATNTSHKATTRTGISLLYTESDSETTEGSLSDEEASDDGSEERSHYRQLGRSHHSSNQSMPTPERPLPSPTPTSNHRRFWIPGKGSIPENPRHTNNKDVPGSSPEQIKPLRPPPRNRTSAAPWLTPLSYDDDNLKTTSSSQAHHQSFVSSSKRNAQVTQNLNSAWTNLQAQPEEKASQKHKSIPQEVSSVPVGANSETNSGHGDHRPNIQSTENGSTPLSVTVFNDITDILTMGSIKKCGGSAEVYVGSLFVSSSSPKVRVSAIRGLRVVPVEGKSVTVAVKRFRVFSDCERDFAKTIAREKRIWSTLDHRNVLPLLGFATVDGLPSLVSEWMANGTVKEYMNRSPQVDATPMAAGIADGLLYLHDNGIIHADLKSDNILVSPEGWPLLSDFGISRLHVGDMTITGTSTLKGNARWMAIELISAATTSGSDRPQLHTKATDIWAYGMVVYELLTGLMPFHNLKSEPSVIWAIMNNQRPVMPAREECREKKYTDILWYVCNRCWASNPNDRMTTKAVSNRLDLRKYLRLLRCIEDSDEEVSHVS